MNDIIGGDQVNQYGHHNIGKIAANGSVLSLVEKAQAITELAEFIDYLQKSGLVSSSGEVVDEDGVRAAISAQESRLRKVAHAVTVGAGRVLSSALDHVVAPLVLKMLESHISGTG